MSGREVLEELQAARQGVLAALTYAADDMDAARKDLIDCLRAGAELEIPIAEMSRACRRPRQTIYEWLKEPNG